MCANVEHDFSRSQDPLGNALFSEALASRVGKLSDGLGVKMWGEPNISLHIPSELNISSGVSKFSEFLFALASRIALAVSLFGS